MYFNEDEIRDFILRKFGPFAGYLLAAPLHTY